MTFIRKSNITPRFYLKDSKAQFSDVYCHLQLHKKKIKIYLKSPIETMLWDKQNLIAMTKSRYKSKASKILFDKIQLKNTNWEKNCKSLNHKIAQIEKTVSAYCNDIPFFEYNLESLRQSIMTSLHGSVNKIEEVIQIDDTSDKIVPYIENLIERMKSGEITKPNSGKYSKDTIDNYNALLIVLEMYQARNDMELKFENIDFNFSKKIQKFMFDCDELDVNKLSTVARYLKDLKSVMTIASKEKVSYNYFDYKHIKVNSMKTTRVALDKNEIKNIKNLELDGDMELYRDMFILAYYIGFRISDLISIEPHHIEKKRITKILIKGHKPYTYKIKKKARNLLKKYGNKVPKLCKQTFRKNIKEIAKLAGITKIIEYKDDWKGQEIISKKEKWQMVSPHTARRSAIKQRAIDGWSEHKLMEFSGHAKSDTLRLYLEVVI